MNQENFKRVEKKFWLTSEQYKLLMNELEQHLKQDAFHESNISNIYYDTKHYDLIRKSIERPVFKEKLRLRTYSSFEKDNPVFIEIKRKYNGIGYKRRASLSYQDALLLLEHKKEPATQIEQEIKEFITRYQIEPKVLLTYHRLAYVLDDDPNCRITFDSELKYKPLQDEQDYYILEDSSSVLLEVKTTTALPLWFSNLLNQLHIYQAPFSKIGECYQLHLKENN